MANIGFKTENVKVEVNVADKRFPGFGIVGLNGKSVEETKERIKTAIITSDIKFPTTTILMMLMGNLIVQENDKIYLS